VGTKSVLITRGCRCDPSRSARRNRLLAVSDHETPTGRIQWWRHERSRQRASNENAGGTAIPAPDRGAIPSDAAFGRQILAIAIGQAETQVPPDRTENDLGLEMPPLEAERTLPQLSPDFSQKTSKRPPSVP